MGWLERTPALLFPLLLLVVGAKGLAKPEGSIKLKCEPGAIPAGDPYLLFPEGKSVFHKAAPKVSLRNLPTPQDKYATALILNIIEALHWSSFPLGFMVVHYIFKNASTIGAQLTGRSSTHADRVFLIMLGLLSQIFGGGIPVMMHIYEGWQVAPFRNPVALPPGPLSKEQGATARLPEYNNAWLRAVAYQMLFTFQTFGLGCFTMAVFGENCWTLLLLGGGTALALLGPRFPRLTLTRCVDGEPRPVLPISWSLAIAAGANIVVNLFAAHKLFYPVFNRKARDEGLGCCSLRSIGAGLYAVLPSFLLGLGGGYEGYVAESGFDQRQHGFAFVILLSGLWLTGSHFRYLVGHNPVA